MVQRIEEIYNTTNFRQKDALNALVLAQTLKEPGISRKEITSRFKLRPSSVSQACIELIDRGILQQKVSADSNQRGRPEVSLYAVTDHWIAACIFMESLDFRAAFIDITGRIRPVKLPLQRRTNADLQSRFENTLNSVISLQPRDSKFIGLGLSLPGFRNVEENTWITSTRLGEIHQVSSRTKDPDPDMKLNWIRSVDARTQALLLSNPEYRTGTTVLFHWGYGICISLAVNGKIINDGSSKFGELGHTIVNYQNGKSCRCGGRGCLETEAALWALLPSLQKRFRDLPENEREFSAFLANRFMEELPEIESAIEYINVGLVTISKLLSPDRILLYGPFTDHNPIYQRVKTLFSENRPKSEFSTINLSRIRHTPADEVIGATNSLFLQALRRDLRAGD